MLKRRLSIRTVLLLIGLLFLLMPLGSLYFLRIYQSALVRQTESELISQAAFVAALYRQEVVSLLPQYARGTYGIPIAVKTPSDAPFEVISPKLDLAKDRIYAARPTPHYTRDQLDATARATAPGILPVLKDAQRITLSGIKVLDYQGIVVAGQQEQGLSFAHTEEFQQAKTGRPVSLLRARRMPKKQAALDSMSRNANMNVFVALPIILENRLIGVVWVNRTPTNLMQSLYSKRGELLWTIGLVLSAVLLITALTAYTITRPIRALVQKNRLITQGDPRGLEPLEHPVTREIDELSRSITTMAKTIQHRSEYIHQFAAHVSHEFKTPLTAIQGSVELLQDNPAEMPQAQQAKFLANIAEDTNRLKQLVTRLLELAQADMAEPFRQAVLLLPILEQLATQFIGEAFTVTIHPMEGQHDVMVQIRPESLEAVLCNLLENSRQAGATRVEITLQSQASAVVLCVQDNGPGISEGNRSEIFTPFFTTRRSTGGTGLGLSIAQSLLERQGGTIGIAPGETGACFTITLPKAI